MKIQIHSFGPIHFFEADLEKDLHLIVGENNTGKSYAITIIYLILKSIMKYREDRYPSWFFFPLATKSLENIVEDIVSGARKSIVTLKIGEEVDISEHFRNALVVLLEKSLVERFQRYYGGTFELMDSIANIYTDEKPRIVLQFDVADVELGVGENSFKITKVKIRKCIKAKGVRRKKSSKESTSEIVVYHFVNDGDGRHFESVFFESVSSFHQSLLNEVWRRIRSIHYLPASRSGLYQALSAFGQIVAQLSKSRSFVTEEIALPAISVPLSDYFIELSGISATSKNNEDNPINIVAGGIENDILKGSVEFDQKNKKIFYVPAGSSLRLGSSSTSSMVSEVSPIVLFLRHILTKTHLERNMLRPSFDFHDESQDSKALLCIEEPEAHLHPANQIKLLNAFAELLNCDVKIIITSHSNYIFHKLNNLILEKKVDVSVIETTVLSRTESGSVGIRPQQDELGIEDTNFLDIAEQLYEEKIELIERLNTHDQ